MQDMFRHPDRPYTLSPAVEVELLLDPLSHHPLPSVANEIVDRCLAVKRISGQNISLLTRDLGMKLTAMTEGLAVIE